MWHRETVTEVFKHCINSPRSPGPTNFRLTDWFAFSFLFSNHFYLHLIKMACQSMTRTLNVEVSECFSHHLRPSFHRLASWNRTEKCICMTEKRADGWWASMKSVPWGLLERRGHISDSYFLATADSRHVSRWADIPSKNPGDRKRKGVRGRFYMQTFTHFSHKHRKAGHHVLDKNFPP